jgi:hypothetical protein
VKRILQLITYGLAALYFLADAAFMTIAKPISDRLGKHVACDRQINGSSSLRRLWLRKLQHMKSAGAPIVSPERWECCCPKPRSLDRCSLTSLDVA